MRLLAVAAAGMWLAAACSSGSPAFALRGASVDPTHWCTGGAKNAPYDLHATIDAHNGTSRAVTIESITAEMRLTAVKGSWLEKVGDPYDAGSAKFEPGSVGAGSSATVRVTIPSACTSGAYGSTTSSYGEYEVTMHVTTSSGTYSISAGNKHEILAA